MSQQNTQPMRIAYLINQYPSVSHTFIRREILALERDGVEVLRFALRGWDANIVDDRDRLEQQKTRYTLQNGLLVLILGLLRYAVLHPVRFWRAFKSAMSMSKNAIRPWPYHIIYIGHACRILRWMDKKSVSHLHAHFGTNSAEIALLVRVMGGPEFSFTVHGTEVADEAKRNAFNQKLAGAKFVAAISSYTGSQLMRHVAPRHWPKISVVHCGLPATAFAKDDIAFPDHPRFLCIGRLSEEKGHLILLESFSNVLKKHPNAKLVIAGNGHLHGMIETRMQELGIKDAVRITGWITSDQVRDEINNCHVLVQPSFNEGLPVVIMEAMAQGRPVISTYIGGIPELIRPGETGWLVPAGSSSDLARAMAESVTMPVEDLRQFGRSGRTRVSERHNIDTTAAQLKSLFSRPS